MTEPKTLLIFESSETGGGSFESLYQHMRIIDRSQYRPVVVCLNDVPHVARVRELGIPVHVINDRLYTRSKDGMKQAFFRKLRRGALRLNGVAPWAFPRIVRWIHRPTIAALVEIGREEHAELVHLNVQPNREFFAIAACKELGIPSVSHLRSADPNTRKDFNPVMARIANSVIDAYIANSGMTRDYWLEAGLDPRKMHTVLNGIPTADVQPVDVRERWGIAPGDLVAGVVGPLRNRYKMDEFTLRGFAAFLDCEPRAVLLIIGDGPMRQVLEEEALRLGIGDRIIMTGHQERVTEIIAGLDVSLVMGTLDSFSRVTIESLQVGTPLIATDIGGIREIIEDGVNGLLVRYGDTEAFAIAMEKLANDEALRAALAENGRRTVREKLSVEAYAAGVAAIYSAVTDGSAVG